MLSIIFVSQRQQRHLVNCISCAFLSGLYSAFPYWKPTDRFEISTTGLVGTQTWSREQLGKSASSQHPCLDEGVFGVSLSPLCLVLGEILCIQCGDSTGIAPGLELPLEGLRQPEAFGNTARERENHSLCFREPCIQLVRTPRTDTGETSSSNPTCLRSAGSSMAMPRQWLESHPKVHSNVVLLLRILISSLVPSHS